MDVRQNGSEIARQTEVINRLRQEINKVLVGQEKLVDSMLVALVGGGHILLEGVPGLAKTTAVQTLAQALGLQFPSPSASRLPW